MAVRFTPCPACARHVKEGEGACPFCGANVPLALAAKVPLGRLSRAALLAAGAAGALAMTDCTASQTMYGGAIILDSSPGDDSSTEGGSAQPHYGAVPPPDSGEPSAEADATASTDSSGTTDASDATAPEAGEGAEGGHMVQPLYGGIAPPYGVPPH